MLNFDDRQWQLYLSDKPVLSLELFAFSLYLRRNPPGEFGCRGAMYGVESGA
jgi:hypothetical protein